MGGSIGVTSCVGVGSTFWLSVPMSRTEAPAATPPSPERRPLPPALILVVDDNPANRRVAQLQLERLGCHADVAADGMEAVRMVALVPYDLILMDCQMPRMDGLAATAEIRRCESGRRGCARRPTS